MTWTPLNKKWQSAAWQCQPPLLPPPHYLCKNVLVSDEIYESLCFYPCAVTLHLLMNHKLQYCPEISYLTFMFATNSYRERWLLKRPFMQVHSKFFTLYFCLEMQSNNNDEDKKLEWYISASQLGECLFCLSPDTIVGGPVGSQEKYDLSSYGKHGRVRTRDKCSTRLASMGNHLGLTPDPGRSGLLPFLFIRAFCHYTFLSEGWILFQLR